MRGPAYAEAQAAAVESYMQRPPRAASQSADVAGAVAVTAPRTRRRDRYFPGTTFASGGGPRHPAVVGYLEAAGALARRALTARWRIRPQQ